MAERTRRRRWPWLVAAGTVVVLVVGAWFAGEWVARSILTNTVRSAVVSQLALPADQKVRVEVTGMVLPQLLRGTLDDVEVASDDVAIDGLHADVAVTLRGVSIFTRSMRSGEATVAVDQTQLRAVLAQAKDLPVAADSVGLSAPDVTATVPLTLFGQTIPLAVALTPGADAGNLTFAFASATVGGATLTADQLQQRFGALAAPLVRTWPVCIADRLPVGVHLHSATVTGARLVARFGIDGRIAVDAALRQKGTCQAGA